VPAWKPEASSRRAQVNLQDKSFSAIALHPLAIPARALLISTVGLFGSEPVAESLKHAIPLPPPHAPIAQDLSVFTHLAVASSSNLVLRFSNVLV
jgi:hypothetical protein